MRHFYGSFFVTFIGLLIAFYVGEWQALYICALLSILEISLSFDNAVVNAKVLDTMDEKWRKRFIYWGIPIAIFGMRFIFPIVIVAVAARLGVVETLQIAIYSPHKYHEVLYMARYEIYAFGSGFLLMVCLQFFLDTNKNLHWIGFIENSFLIKILMKLPNIVLLLAVCFGIILMVLSHSVLIGISYFCAIVLYALVHSADELLGVGGVRSGLVGFLYLELLDASFSFDGVIGAFALSENIFIIMIGLGIGAMFVRSLTLYLVEKKTLQELIYIEHGAHYAIGVLAIIMFLKIFVEVSEIITGLLGVTFIAISFLCSKLAQKY